jgi:signal recognition particle subunit SRP54
MSEIKQIKDLTKPAETILVADSLTGQIAVNVAREFDAAVNLSSIILTRVDGDARGGAALSMKHVTGKPIKYIGVGEKVSDIEMFHPDRLANRILGMGDVVTLVEKAAQDLSEEKIKETEEDLKKGIFTMDSYLSQLRQMKKMGGMEGVMSMLPGVSKMKGKMDQANIDERMLIENEAIILSMTKKEKENPKIISGSRRKRISQGAGVDVTKINKLLKQFKMMSDMMKKMSQGKKIPSEMIPDEMLNQLK